MNDRPPGGYQGPPPVKAPPPPPPPPREVGFLERCFVALCCCSPCCDPTLPVSVGSNGSKSEKNQSTDGSNLDPTHFPKTNKPAANNVDRPSVKVADLPEVHDGGGSRSSEHTDPVDFTDVPPTVPAPGYQPTAVTVTTTPAPPEHEVNVLPVPTPTTVNHTPVMQPVTGQTGQPNYRTGEPDVYRESPMYNMVPPPITAAQGPIGVMRPSGAGVGETESGYTPVAVSGEMRHNGGGGALSHDG